MQRCASVRSNGRDVQTQTASISRAVVSGKIESRYGSLAELVGMVSCKAAPLNRNFHLP